MNRIQRALDSGGRLSLEPEGPTPPLRTLTHKEKLMKDYDFYKKKFYEQRQKNFKQQEAQIQILEDTLRQMSDDKGAPEAS